MEIEFKQQILERRKKIEKELLDMLKETESDFGLDDIKEIIYNEDGQDSLTDIIAMFDTGQGAAELQNIPELVNDAWNYFPHKTLGGLSPAEMMLKYEREDKEGKRNKVFSNRKLTAKQRDLLWGGGGEGPYSQVNLRKQIRILDNSVSRIFLVVETEINPTTFEIVKGNRNNEELKNNIVIQQLLDSAEYRGPQFGYVATAFEEEFVNNEGYEPRGICPRIRSREHN